MSIDPRDLRLLWQNEQIRAKNFTAGNQGDGSVYGLVPFDLAGQKKPNADDDDRDDDDRDDEETDDEDDERL